MSRGPTGEKAETQSRADAFTLVELLVTIGVIALLAALVFPALSRGKAASRGAQCTNNHHQLVLAWGLYCDEHHGLVPSLTNWVAGDMSKTHEATNALLLVDPQRSPFARYIPNPAIYKCPEDRSLHVRSVSMNNRLNPNARYWIVGGGSRYEVFLSAQQIRVPAQIYVTTDERSETINDTAFCVDMSNTGNLEGVGADSPYWMIDYPGCYHDRADRFSFVDGHVESHRWLEPTTLVAAGQAEAVTHTSGTDRDVQWLQEHCTYAKQ